MKRTGLVVLLIILLILSAGTNAFLYMNSNDAVAKKQLELVAVRDSLQKELLRIEDSLNAVVISFQLENDSLVNKISELESDKNPKILAAYREINRLRRQLINGAGTDGDNSGSGSGKNVDLSALRKQLSEAKNRIKELVAQVDSLTTQKNQLIADVEVVKNEKEAITAENVELKERLEKGGIPQFGTLITSAFDDAKKLTTKSKSIDRFTITFDVLENPMVTNVVEEEVTIRLIDPDGGVLSVTNKTLQDKSKVYSLKNSITFDGALQKVKWSFPPKGTLKGKLKKGKYITELWTRDLLRQKNTFELK